MGLPQSQFVGFLERLGFDPKMVKEFTARPTDVTVTLFKADRNGSKHVDPETGIVAIERHCFRMDHD